MALAFATFPTLAAEIAQRPVQPRASAPRAAEPAWADAPLPIPAAALSVCAAAVSRGARRPRGRAVVCRRAETATVERTAAEGDADLQKSVAGDAVSDAATEDKKEEKERPWDAIPFLPEPEYRKYTANVPGDAGFDPLGLAGGSPETFKDMLEAETKHGRVAMLAFTGIIAAEAVHSPIAEAVGLDDLLVDGCVPTLQNGGLFEPETAVATIVAFAFFSYAEIVQPRLSGVPGYFGFDPLGVGGVQFSDLAKSFLRNDVPWVAEAEAKHGRVAMLALVYVILSETITGVPTVR